MGRKYLFEINYREKKDTKNFRNMQRIKDFHTLYRCKVVQQKLVHCQLTYKIKF